MQDWLSIPRTSEGCDSSPEMRLSAERVAHVKADDQEYDFLQRHVRFIEDFTKEGREIKQELKMHRNMQASPIAKKDKLFSNQRKINL